MTSFTASPSYERLLNYSSEGGASLMATAAGVDLPTEGALNTSTTENPFANGENRISFYGDLQLIVLWVLVALTVVGNLTVLLAVYVIRHKKSRLNFFVAHLAAADLLVGVINAGYEILYKYMGEFYGGTVFCKIIRYLQAYVINVSSFQLVALSLDRFFAIVFPMDFSGSGKRANLMAGTAWIGPLFASIPSAIVFEAKTDVWGTTHCFPPPLQPGSWQYKVYTLYVVSGFFYIPLIVISTCYIFMVVSIWRRSKYMMGQKPDKVKVKVKGKAASKEKEPMKHRASSRGLIPKAKIKTLKMTVCIIVAFILCWCPFSIFYTLDAFRVIIIDEVNLNTAFRASAFIQNLPYLSSAINPFIYGLFSTNICQELRRFRVINWMATKLRCCKSWRPSRYGRSTLRTDTNLTEMSEGGTGTHRSHSRPMYVYTPARTSNSDNSREMPNSAM